MLTVQNMMQPLLRSLRPSSAGRIFRPECLGRSSVLWQTAQRPWSQPAPYRAPTAISARFESSLATVEPAAKPTPPKPKEPSYQLTFTCKPCQTRSSHIITKHGYHRGTVLITCSGCRNRHVISDHLKIFMDEQSTLEDILQRTAGTDQDVTKLLKKGTLGRETGELVGNEGDADIEFWDDGTRTPYKPMGDGKGG